MKWGICLMLVEWSQDLNAFWLTIKLALVTVSILLLLAIPFGWWLSRYRGKAKPIIEAIIALPLVLPPTVLGFYLLIAFSPDTWFGQGYFWLTGKNLAFSFEGILIGSLIYSLPFVVQPIVAGFQQLPDDFDKMAASMGLPSVKRFVYLTLPLIKPSLISAATLGFAHTLGEFGLVLMIGGNIPEETQVLSIALFTHVEMLNYQQAHRLAGILLLFSFISLLLLYKFNRPQRLMEVK